MNNIGQFLMIGVSGTKVTPETANFLKEGGIGGVILFKENIVSLKQVARFIKELRDAAEGQLIVGVDQEGGRVARLPPPFPETLPMRDLAISARNDKGLVFRTGALMGRELKRVGFNIDFAPVLDVATNIFNPVIGDRAFSFDAGLVARLGSEFILGMQGEGVAACGKHFPGHGDTDVDSHFGLPLLGHTRRRFDLCEFIPFRAAIESGVASMMIAHLMIPSLDPDSLTSLSRRVITGILRKEFGYDGLIFTDDLTMRGVADLYPPGESAWRAIAAGADVAMVCHDIDAQRAALEGIKRAEGEGRIDQERIKEAGKRVEEFGERYC